MRSIRAPVIAPKDIRADASLFAGADRETVTIGQRTQLFEGETAAATFSGDQDAGPETLRARGAARLLGAQPPPGAGTAECLCAVVGRGGPSVGVVGAGEPRAWPVHGRTGRGASFAQPHCGTGSSISLHGLALPS